MVLICFLLSQARSKSIVLEMSPNHKHSRDTANIKTAFFLNLGFTLLEIVGGILTNSVAILSDALHDLGDSLSLGMSLWLEHYSEKEASDQYSYGYRRFSLLGALINSVVLITGSIFVLFETVPRLLAPEATNAEGMIVLAVIGVAVNGLAVFKLSGGKSENIKVLSWHLLEDVLGWAAVLVGAIIIYFTEFYLIDPLLSVGITGLILWNVYRRLNSTLSLFLQGTPSNIDLSEIKTRLLNISGVSSEHHTHAWSLDGELHILTTHLVMVKNTEQSVVVVKERVRALANELGFSHVTVEIDFTEEDCSMHET